MFFKNEEKRIITYIFQDGTTQNFEIQLTAILTKFEDVFQLVNMILMHDTELRNTYEDFLKSYVKATDDNRMRIFITYIDKLMHMIDKNFEELELAKNLNVKVESKFVMNVNYDESVSLFKASVRTRFFLICYLSSLSVTPNQQKVLHSIIYSEILSNGVVDKLYRILNSIVMNTYPTKSGKKLWDLISATGGYNSDSYALKLMASMFYKAMPSLKADENPIAYMISICKNETDWLLRTNFGFNCYNSFVDTESIVHSNSKIIENEIYYRSIVKNCFVPISKQYKDYLSMSKYNVYPTLFNISQPIIHKIFDIPMRFLNIENMSLVNFYVHSFLSRYDPSMTVLMKMLVAVPVVTKISSNTENVLPEDLRLKIQTMLTERNVQRRFSFISHITLKKIITEAVTTLHRYTYIDIVTNTEIFIDWNVMINQYIDFIFNIVTDEYTYPIRQEIFNLNF